jgi:amino acid transporter
VTTYADEVEHPIRSYIKATIIAFVTVIVVYVSVIIVAQQSHINYEVLTKQGFPALGKLVGGEWLGILIASAGLAGTIGLYNANLLSVSRLPKAMADDGLLPAALNKVHPKFQTPYVSILTCSVVISLMVLWTFGELVIIDVTIYGAGLFLEYISLIRLRIAAPDVHRPFRIPLNVPGLCILALCPVAVYGVALTGVCLSSSAFILPAVFAIGILFSAELGWQVVVWQRRNI